MATKAVGYIRVSTDEQATTGVSLDAQEAKIRAYCALYDIELVRIECDAGISAKSLDRRGIQSALASLRSGEADAVIVAKLDRLTRRTRDLLDLVERYFADGRRSLLSVHEQIDTRTSAGRMVITVLGALAQFEREQIGERTAQALAHKRAQGKRVGGIPYGFQLASDGESLVAHVEEQATIAQARALRSSGLSLRATAETLAERGLCARSGRPFAPSAIASMVEAA